MSDKDEIKELFQRELGNYETKVDPGLWQGIQTGISAGTSTAAASIGVGAKVVIGIVSVAAISVASYVIYNVLSNDASSAQEKITQQEQVVEKHEEKFQQEGNEINKKEEANLAQNKEDEREAEQDNTEIENESRPVQEMEKNSSNPEIYSEKVNKDSSQQEKSTTESTDVEPVDKAANKESTPPVKEIEKKEEESNDSPLALTLIPKIASQKNQYVEFDVNTKNIEEIVWNFGDGNFSTLPAPEHFYDEAGTYDVVVKGRNGDREISKTITVEIEIEGELLKLPNIFTPNGDGSSDYLFVETKGIKEFQITIMNDKQEVVFESNDASFRWDGTMQNGIPAPEGNYVYIIIAKDNQGNTLNKYQQLRISR